MLTNIDQMESPDIEAGASGTAGAFYVFPATASKGQTKITAADNTGNTVTTITTAAQAAARTYTVPDAGADASFVMSAGTSTFAEGANFAVGTATGTKIGTATTQKLGFWNATPVVQQVLATGAAHTSDDIITFLQLIGLCKQA